MMHVAKFVQHFCIITPYFWGTWTSSKSREMFHALLLPCTFLGWPQRRQLPDECEGKQTGQTTREAGRRLGQRPGPPEGPVGMSKVEPSRGTESCQETASFAISYSFSLWLEGNFIDQVLHKPKAFWFSLSGFHPHKVKRIINHS